MGLLLITLFVGVALLRHGGYLDITADVEDLVGWIHACACVVAESLGSGLVLV